MFKLCHVKVYVTVLIVTINFVYCYICSIHYRIYKIHQLCLFFIFFYLLQVFDSQGSFLSFINTTAEPLYGPQGLTINVDNHVVVADSGNHCIKIYRYLQ